MLVPGAYPRPVLPSSSLPHADCQDGTSLFTQAIAYPLSEQAQFLDKVCGADRDLKCDFELLLANELSREPLGRSLFREALRALPRDPGR